MWIELARRFHRPSSFTVFREQKNIITGRIRIVFLISVFSDSRIGFQIFFPRMELILYGFVSFRHSSSSQRNKKKRVSIDKTIIVTSALSSSRCTDPILHKWDQIKLQRYSRIPISNDVMFPFTLTQIEIKK